MMQGIMSSDVGLTALLGTSAAALYDFIINYDEYMLICIKSMYKKKVNIKELESIDLLLTSEVLSSRQVTNLHESEGDRQIMSE